MRSRIDPHFLFNTLNTLRSMVRQAHPGSEEFIICLADFYREVLRYNEANTITIKEESKMLDAYLFLMKSRNEAAVIIESDIHTTAEHLLIPTLALQTVVENCFKEWLELG